ncbi:MAG: adenosylcobalamin-dependent ribonucleoside-diphosphate reductase [Methanomassiliicoccales archaeon]|nr:MAG: adenosylcobalamin-dependent ribonucleoside-diphosphate reductase [Methanomassiliicoccales archaeon]
MSSIEPPLTKNALVVLKRRYLRKDTKGTIIETPGMMIERVADNISSVDYLYGDRDADKEKSEFVQAMRTLRFLPNSPTLMNAGTSIQQLAACFVIPVEDSIEGIFNAVKWAAIVHQSGGGTGFSFSRLRPRGDIVASTSGAASGPLSFMKVFDIATEAVRQGGRRRGASMGVLRVDHPDIMEFIHSKDDKRTLSNFNISVGITDEFMDALTRGDHFILRNPRDGSAVGEVEAVRIFEEMCSSSWASGDPGVLFLDTIERSNPTPNVGTIEATNPCGEVPLLPFEACNLGSIDLVKMYDRNKGDMDWDLFKDTISLGIRFLDNVIDASKYPLDQITSMVKGNRKIGLGVMGFADLLLLQGVRYGSRSSFDIAGKLMDFMRSVADEESRSIASSRGPFPNIEGSKVDPSRRNATLLSIAPTGTISIIAGCSSGIEPNYSFYLERRVLDGEILVETNPILLEMLDLEKVETDRVIKELSKGVPLKEISTVPEYIKEVFVTAHEIDPLLQVDMQAKFQEQVDNAVSKTINLPMSATPDEIGKIMIHAFKKKCKGITVYREGSKPGQVLSLGTGKVECFTCGKLG